MCCASGKADVQTGVAERGPPLKVLVYEAAVARVAEANARRHEGHRYGQEHPRHWGWSCYLSGC